MKATELLMDEHRVIERVIGAVEVAVTRLRNGEPVEPEFFLRAADFIREFADGCHHAKEEGVLFKAMAAAGMPTEGGPIAVMLAEHDQGRAYTRGMVAAAERLKGGDREAAGEVAENAVGYAALLRQHIMKEDQILYPMADQIIPAQNQALVLEDCLAAEQAGGGHEQHARYLALADSLVAQAGS